VGISTILHVELLAIYHGLKVAWDQGYRNIICYSDSTLSIQLVEGEVSPWHHYASILANIKALVKRNWSICFKHTMREANTVADLLARQVQQAHKLGLRSENLPPQLFPSFKLTPLGLCLQGDSFSFISFIPFSFLLLF
jgi:ribonuclease HI